MTKTKTKTITENALMKRINRKLEDDGETLRISRDRARGCYVTSAGSMLSNTSDELEGVAREIGVLATDEVLEGAEGAAA